jgi:hypothetical protein
MKHIIALVALSLVGGCAAASAEDQAMARADGEATLAAELRDHRPSGPPVSCVPLRNLQGLWVNRPPAGCPVIDSGRAISLRTTGTQLCRGEIVNVFDPVNGFNYGSCGLGDFEPYERRRDN